MGPPILLPLHAGEHARLARSASVPHCPGSGQLSAASKWATFDNAQQPYYLCLKRSWAFENGQCTRSFVLFDWKTLTPVSNERSSDSAHDGVAPLGLAHERRESVAEPNEPRHDAHHFSRHPNNSGAIACCLLTVRLTVAVFSTNRALLCSFLA